MTPLPRLSVVIPTFNEAAWIQQTIISIDAELSSAEWHTAEIIVVNDGSTDNTREVLMNLTTKTPLRIVQQENQGRFRARWSGIKVATGEVVLLTDSRVRPVPGAFAYLADQLVSHPERKIWAGDVDLNEPHKPYAALWVCITRIAWRRYFKNRELTSFGFDDFDYYPKGTTFFLAPRDLLLSTCESFMSKFEDLSLANDDTLLIKPMSKVERIYISPEFRCVYFSRDSMRKFVRHSYHRGTVFVDAYLRSGSRYLAPICLTAVVGVISLILAVLNPLIFLTSLSCVLFLSVMLLLLYGIEGRTVLGFLMALPFFVPSYASGLVRGLYLSAVATVKKRRSR